MGVLRVLSLGSLLRIQGSGLGFGFVPGSSPFTLALG